MKKLRMLLTILMVASCSWQSAWAKEVVVSVSLAEPGSLGVEILKQHDPIKEVTNLTVTGAMNGDDWAKIRDKKGAKGSGGITELENQGLQSTGTWSGGCPILHVSFVHYIRIVVTG